METTLLLSISVIINGVLAFVLWRETRKAGRVPALEAALIESGHAYDTATDLLANRNHYIKFLESKVAEKLSADDLASVFNGLFSDKPTGNPKG